MELWRISCEFGYVLHCMYKKYVLYIPCVNMCGLIKCEEFQFWGENNKLRKRENDDVVASARFGTFFSLQIK